MRAIIQRVSSANVKVGDKIISEINNGMLILLGIETEDNESDAKWLVTKIISLRIFNDTLGKMNLAIKDVKGSFLVVSQFTLHASIKKGNRPSYIKSARPELAITLYEYFIKLLTEVSETEVKVGIFGADMKVSLLNDGPVTIMIDTKNLE